MDIFKINQEEGKKYLESFGLLKYLTGGSKDQLKPNYSDLARLHYLVVKRKAFTVLEFGVGWSTIVLAGALRLNKEKWDNLKNKPAFRESDSFKIFSVDSSRKWIKTVHKLIPPELKNYIKISYSDVVVGLFNDRACHFYKLIPNVVPDFIYLDGPDPSIVKGVINGVSWKNKNRTVMSGDILRIEPTFLPGAFIIVDGRTNNARFLENNLQRNWFIRHHEEADLTTMELQEPPLGEINKKTLLYCFGDSSYKHKDN